MGVRAAFLILGLWAMTAPALARDVHGHKPVGATAASKVAAKKSSAEKPVPDTSQTPAASQAGAAGVEQTGTVKHRKAKARPKGPSAAELISANAAMPEAQRLVFQSDLAAGRGSAGTNGWQLIEDPATGARLAVPERLVPNVSSSRTGSRWTSAQGQIQIETFRLTEAALPALFEDEKKASHRQVTSSAFKPDSFVISGAQGLKNFLVRVEAKGSELRGITILYDQATQGIMGRVAVAVASAFTGFPDPNAGPPPGTRRRVEYGTAIVVGARGDLITSAQVTEGCQAIVVPGFGHAERLAADKNDDLALLRLNGVRNLAPVALGTESKQSDDVTLVGVADPLAQAGDGAVTRVAARLSGQGIDPAPPPGFSGAAAVDAQGHLAGMVDLKPAAAIAGVGSAVQDPALVPVGAIRAFLQTHGVAFAAAAEPAAMNESVLRVVCVRK